MTTDEFFKLLGEGFNIRVVGSPINQDFKGKVFRVPSRKYLPYEGIYGKEIVQDELGLSLEELAEMLGCSFFKRTYSIEVVRDDQAQ